MKKLLMLLMLAWAARVNSGTIVPHGFTLTNLGRPSVTTGQLIYKAHKYGDDVIRKIDGRCITQPDKYGCIFVGKYADSVYLATLPANATYRLTASCPIVSQAILGIELERSNGETYKYNWSGGGPTTISLPSTPLSTSLKSSKLEVLGSISGHSAQGMYCELYLDDPRSGRSLLTSATLMTDYSAGGVPMDLTVTPSTLALQGPQWSGTVQINGAGFAGVLRILSNVPVKIDLGAGPSDTGMDFETTIKGDSGSAVGYRGPMRISGAVPGPGLHRYTINLVYEVT